MNVFIILNMNKIITVRASDLEKLKHCSAYYHNKLAGMKEKYSEYIQRSFEDGKIHEPSIIEFAAERYGIENYRTQVEGKIELDGAIITGTADAVSDRCVIEAKFIRRRAITNILEEERHQYWLQVQTYLNMLNIDTGVLVMRDKDTPKNQRYNHYIKETKKDPEGYFEEIGSILKNLKEPKPPEEGYWLCSPNWCGFYHDCEYKNPFEEEMKIKSESESEKLTELEELVNLYREISEEASSYITKKQKLAGDIKALMKELNVGSIHAGDKKLVLVTRVQRVLKDNIPDEFYELREVDYLSWKQRR